METYSYVQNGGGIRDIDAESPQMALDHAENIAPNSGVIKPSLKSEVSTLSTNQGQNIVDKATAEHNADMARLGANQTPTPTDTTKTPKPANGALSYDEAKATGVDLNTATYDQATNTYIPSMETTSPEITKLNEGLKADEMEINNAFDGLSRDADAATQALISSISGLFDGQIARTQEQNKRGEQTLGTFGTRQGTNRYAGEVAQGIMNAEQRAGIARVNELVAKKAQAISEANQALSDKKYSIFIQKRDELKQIRAETQKTLKGIQDSVIASQKEQKKQQIQSSRDSAIAGLLEKGVSDPRMLLNYLNFDQNGNQVGDWTAEEIQKSIKNLAPEPDDAYKSLTGATKNFYILKDKGMLPEDISNLPQDKQLFSYLQKEKQASTIVKNSLKATGKGGTTSTGNKPSPALIDQQMKDLHDPRVFGSDGYVDPIFYKQKFDAWIEDGYSVSDFIKHFKPNEYVNPEGNVYLPTYLQTTKKTKKATTGGA